MCTGIIRNVPVSGSGKGVQGWLDVTQANVSYDHPSHVFIEHSLNIDFVNESTGPEARVAVELTPESARALAHAILAALETGEMQYGLPSGEESGAAAAR